MAAKPSDAPADQWRASTVVFVCGSTSERSYDSEFDDNGAAKAVTEYGATCGEGVDLSDIRLPWRQDDMLGESRGIDHRSNCFGGGVRSRACTDRCAGTLRRDDLGRICRPIWAAGRSRRIG